MRIRQFNFRRLRHAALQPIFQTSIWWMTLPSRAGRAPEFPSIDLWPGDAARGAVIISGDFQCAGKTIREADAPWLAAGVSRDWVAAVSSFDWLRDLRAAGGDAARERGRALILRWIETHGANWRKIAWRPDILGARIANWIENGALLTSGADEIFIEALTISLRQQAAHLQRTAKYAAPGAPRIRALKGLIFAGLAFGGGNALVKPLRTLDAQISHDILSDGCHLSRSPTVQLAVLRDLIDIRAALRDAQQEVPESVQTMIDRMAPMLRFFRHGDGGLALFNGADEDEGWLIDVTLTRSEARGKPLESAPHAGFERLTANRTLVLIDVGAPPPSGYDSEAHAGPLSFEMSTGKERIVVNCGAHRGDSADWQMAQRTTAAHSTITIEDQNAAEIFPGGGIGEQIQTVLVERREADGSVWIDSSHDGYSRPFGITHQRRLYLSANGGDLRGEDSLTGDGSQKFVARFHLHPAVRASMVQEGSSVLLRLASGEGWRFRASGCVISLQESVYLGIRYTVKRTEQIVVSSATQNGESQIKWAFTRLAKES
jgi:uncharacterized heparinase superfamily protein